MRANPASPSTSNTSLTPSCDREDSSYRGSDEDYEGNVNINSRSRITTRRSLARAKTKPGKEGTEAFKRPERKKRHAGGEDAGGYKQNKYSSVAVEAENVKLELCEEENKKRPDCTETEDIIEDFSNPFCSIESLQHKHETPSQCIDADFVARIEKMRDAIDLYRFMNRTDRFSEQPRHRPFMLRNLGYLRRRTGTCPMVVESNLLSEQRACKKARRKEANEEEVELMPSTIKFNFIRNNLCFGDKSAIVQCFHVTENNYNFGAVTKIPSSTFDMKVNEKLSLVSIDLPDSFSHEFIRAIEPLSQQSPTISRVEYFLVRVVFRYEDAKVGGGKHLRKVPSRENSRQNFALQASPAIEEGRHSEEKEMAHDRHRNIGISDEVVMFGAKAITQYSADEGLDVHPGEASIVLFSSKELKIPDSDWMTEPASLIPRLLKLQRKATDNPFMSIQVHGEEDGDSSTGDEAERRPQIKIRHSFIDRDLAISEAMPAKIALKFVVGPQACSVSDQISRESSIISTNSHREGSKAWWSATGNDPMNLSSTHGSVAHRDGIRVINPVGTCFFCLSRIQFSDLNAYLLHCMYTHPRLSFTYESNIPVSSTVQLPGFIVDLNRRFDGSHEWDPSWHYVRKAYGQYPRRRIVNEPIWLVTKELSRHMKSFTPSGIGDVPSIPATYFNILRDYSFAHAMVRGGARFIFNPPTRINHIWLMQTNHLNLSEITDLHESEQQMMQLWNDFLAEIRITHIGKSMVYKALEKRQIMAELKLWTNFLLHLTSLMSAGVLSEEERYDLFMRLDQKYSPTNDNVHYVAKHLAILEKEYKTATYIEDATSDLQKRHSSQYMRSFSDLKSLFPFAPTRKLEKIFKYIEDYTQDKLALAK